jgi:hypothetical protein
MDFDNNLTVTEQLNRLSIEICVNRDAKLSQNFNWGESICTFILQPRQLITKYGFGSTTKYRPSLETDACFVPWVIS